MIVLHTSDAAAQDDADEDQVAMVVNEFGQQVNPVERDNKCRVWIRGIIQNELDVVNQLCSLDDDLRHKLVDFAEREWKSKTSNIVKANAASNFNNQVDIESRVEKLFVGWMSEILPPEKLSKYQEEIALRYELRKRVVVGKMIVDTEKKIGLTSTQMEELRPLLVEKWKESWWGMYRGGTLPETRFSWIDGILTASQRTIGMDRNANNMGQTFVQETQVVDYPSKALTERFEIESIKSAESIELVLPAGPKSSKKTGAAKAQLPPVEVPVENVSR